jgi:hypothetical protein
MSQNFHDRLNQILPRITSDDFLQSKGLGNEIGFWIFDYPPEREMDVREFVSGTVLPALDRRSPPLRLHQWPRFLHPLLHLSPQPQHPQLHRLAALPTSSAMCSFWVVAPVVTRQRSVRLISA